VLFKLDPNFYIEEKQCIVGRVVRENPRTREQGKLSLRLAEQPLHDRVRPVASRRPTDTQAA
jgi:hypothetical protein